jgi:RHS repeat-associated protein
MNSPNRWKALRAFALAAFATTGTVLCASTALLAPVDARAVASAAAKAEPAPQQRARFVAPLAGHRLPHASTDEFRRAAYLPTAGGTDKRAASPKDAATTLAPPCPADLAESDEVVLTPAIRDLAESLGRNPVRIYNWVRDHVAFAATYGSMQGAEATLQARRGNAFDTASLLIALLRASDVPARYAYGTIEVPAAAAQNWVGGVDVPEAAVALFDQGGIPVQAVSSGGGIAAIRIEHVWVDAWVDFDPSRGAVNRTASAWVPLDASYKQYQYSAGLPIRNDVPVDTNALATQLAQGATITPDGVAGLDASGLGAAFTDFGNRVATYISVHKPNATVADVLGSQAIVAEGLPILAGALPYRTVALGAVYAELPDTLRWKVRYGIYADTYEHSQDHAIVALTRSMPALVGKHLTLSFAGATAADDSRIATQLGASPLPASLAAAMIRTTAQLALGDDVIASDASIPLGTALVGSLAVFEPQAGAWSETPESRVVAGETQALTIVGQGVSPAALAAGRDRLADAATRLSAHDYAGVDRDRFVGDVLGYAGLSYATTVAGVTDLMCRACGIVGHALPTIVRVGTRADVLVANGLPQNLRFPGLALTVEAIGRTAVATDGNAQRALAFQRTYGERASTYAHLVLDALFTDAGHAGRASSTVRALSAAAAAGQTIFHVTGANAAALLPQIDADAAAVATVRDGVQAGRTATISRSNIAIDAWNGVGYLLEDAASGSGDYEISGRESAELDVAAGWLPLAFAGPALAVQGDAVAAAMQGTLAAETGYYGTAVALLADYGTIPWTSFLGAPAAQSQWWLCALWNGLPTGLGDIGTSVVSTIVTGDTTTLPGASQTNSPPYFTSTPVVNGALGQPYQYFASALDPDGDALIFQLVGGPTGMSLSAGGLLAWPSPVTGSYPVTLRVSDGHANVEQVFTLTIGQVMPLDLNLAIAPQYVNEGDPITITVATTGGSGTVSKSLTIDGADVPLDGNGQAHVVANGAGAHAVVAIASDNRASLTRSGAFGVHVDGDTSAPTVQITAPADGDVLTAPTSVTGVVADPNLASWLLQLSPTGQNQWRELARGAGAVSGALGTLDPTQLTNGQYDLALTAWDANGRSANTLEHVLVQGDLKLGAFTVSFNDIQLDVGGVPLTITRTYDSRKKDQKGDFGYGWMLSYQNVTLQRNRPLGEQWEMYQPGFLTFCVRPIGKRVVSIALSDGKVHQFDVAASEECALGQVPTVFSMVFKARPGTTSTLDALDSGSLLYQGGTVYDPDEGIAFDSSLYQLTTLENYKYMLRSSDGAKTFKVVQITDPNGQTLVLNAQGVFAGNGAALQFTRDAGGRITQVTDPSGRKVKYAYTTNGDLDSITSPLNQVSRNQYATVPASLAHLLTSYTDAAGVQQVRNEYDASGKLIAQYDALGNKVDLSQRDLDTHTQKVIDRNGNTITYTFDDMGNITKIVGPDGGVTSATFDAFGNQLTTADPLGRTTSTTYDAASGTVLTQTDALGNTTTSEWNFFTMFQQHTPQNLKSTTDALGHKTNYWYTDPGMLRSIEDPLGHATGFGWSGANFDQLAQLTDPTGNVTHYVNDAQGRKTQETDPLGNVTKYTYDTAGHLLTTTKIRVVAGQTQTLTTTNTVDADGNVLTTTDALGNVMRNTWTAQKQLATQTDALGRLTRYAYDASGRPTQTTYPDGATESSAYDANGNTTRQVDRAGRATQTAYDALNRPTTVTNPDGTTTGTTYDAAGQVTDTADELGRITHVDYDAAGRRTARTDANGHATTFAYDATGKLTGTTDALSHTTGYVYDAANRRTQTTWPDSTTSKYEYDAAGRKTKDTDPANRATQYGYDANGRLNKVTDALGKITQYGYDELGNKTSQTDALNHVTSWGYDALGRGTSHTLPDNRYETMAYDAVGRLTNRTDYAGDASGLQYDTADRVRSQTFVDGTVLSWTYTPSGQVATLTLAKDGQSKLTKYSYDTRDRLTDIENADQSRLHYAYDAVGQKVSQTLTTPDQQSWTIGYTYDDVGNLKTVTANGQTFTYTYDDANRKQTREDPNGVVTQYTYDANGRLTGFVAQKGTTIISQGTYTLNPAGQRTNLAYVASDGATRNLAWTYDGAGRLTKETRNLPAHTTSWTLDAVGNRTNQTKDGTASTYTYDVTDRLTKIIGGDAATYAWDTNGQLQGKTIGSGSTAQTTAYAFNSRHYLDSVTKPDGSAIRFTYAADGNLESRTKTSGATTETTHYLVDPNLAFAQVVAEYGDDGHASAVYVYGDELLLRIEPAQANKASVYHHDGLGSVVALTDETGAAIQTYGYDAWGNRVESTGSDANPYGYAGERYDVDTGLVYLRARWYEPGIGRFVSEDPAAGNAKLPASLNKYQYSNTDPANRVDPSGLMTMAETSVAGNIATGLAVSALAYIGAKLFIGAVLDNSTGTRTFGLWDAVAVTQFRAKAASEDRADPLVDALVQQAVREDGHHTIPVYVCGSMDQETSRITRAQHVLIHTEIAAIAIALDGAEQYATRSLGRTRASVVLRIAQTEAGRHSITNALQQVYDIGGWWGVGTPPIGNVFMRERPYFESGAKTSLPWCSRSGAP